MTRYLKSAMLGIAIGNLSSLWFSFLFGDGAYFPMNPYSTMGKYYLGHFNGWAVMLISVVLWSSIGILFEVTGQIFNKNWSLLKASIVHFLLSFSGFFPLAILSGWFPLSLEATLFFVLSFIVIYALIYGINYQIMRHNIQHINKGLRKK